MDFLKKAVGKDKQEEHSEQPSQSQQAQGENLGESHAQTGKAAQGQGQGQASKPDYVDQAFDQGAKRAGYSIDPDKREKITDAGREAFEKATGTKVPDKVSN